MIQAYRNLGWFFLALLLVIMAGFYQSYLGLVPDFKGLPFLAHIHFLAFLLWFSLLIIQPFLIKSKKYKLHRNLGVFSYFLIPALIYTAHEMQKFGYKKDLLHYSKTDALEGLINTYLDISFFTLFYLIAIVFKRKLPIHICFIIGTSLVLLNPGLGRLVGHTWHSELITYIVTYSTMYLIIIGFLLYEKVKLRRPFLTSPFLLLLLLLITEHLLYFTIPTTPFWHWTAQKIVMYLY